MPALVRRAARLEGLPHLTRRPLGGAILVGEDHPDRATQHLGFRPAQDALGTGVPAGDASLGIHRHDGIVGGAVEDARVQQALLGLLAQGAAQLHLRHRLAGEPEQARALPVAELMGLGVEDADGADWMTVGGLQQRPGVEAQPRLPRDERIALEARVPRRVGYVEEILLQDSLATERSFDWRLPYAQSDFGLEELPPVPDQVDHRDGSPAQLGGRLGNLVEILLTRRVDQAVTVEGAQARRFVLAYAGEVHRNGSFARSGWFRERGSRAAKVWPPAINIGPAAFPRGIPRRHDGFGSPYTARQRSPARDPNLGTSRVDNDHRRRPRDDR